MKKLMLTLLGLGAIFIAEAYETSDVDYGQTTSSPTLDLIWEFDTVIYNSKTCAKITGVKNSGGDTVSGDISVPQTLVYNNQSYIVKKIAAGAFANQIGISSITIPLTVEDIETPFCPGCTLLSSITVDAASPWFASVDGLLFDKDKEVLIACPPTLDTVSLPSTLLEIGDEAFAGCFRFKTLEMPAGVENIGSRAFANCKRLKSLTFRGNAPGVGTDVFSGSTPTLTIYIPEGNTTFGSVPGTWQGQNLNYSTGGQITGVTSAVSGYVEWWFRVVDGQAELYNNGQSCIKTSISSTSTLDAESSKEVADGELRIPSTLGGYPVTKIGDNAFRNCSALVTVVIPDSITSIGDTAFKNCTGINSLTLPGNMKSIGSHAFEGTSMTSLALPDSLRVLDGNPMAGCDTMLTVTIAADNSYYTVINGLLYDKDVKLLVGCPARKESAPLAATCTAIGSEAFYGCFRLNNISLPEHLTSVGENAFYAMPRLASLVFPKSVTTLEGAALFNGCTALAFIGFSCNAPAHDADLLLGTPSTTKIYVDNGTKGWDGDPDSTALPSSGKWPNGANGRPIENFSVTPAADLKEGDIFTLINTNGTMYAWTLKVLANRGVEILAISPKPTGTFSVPESFDSSIGTLTVKSVGSRLLANATGLLKATFPNTVTNIGDEVFANCDVLAEVTLAYGLRSIGRHVFAGSAIETITLPDTVQSIAGNILAGCNPSTAVAVGANNPSFAVSAEGALYDKDFTTLFAVPMLTEEIAIPATVTAFAEECFLDCLRLKKVTFAGNAPTAADGDDLYLDAHAALTNYVAESSTGFGPVPGTWHLRPVVSNGETPAEESEFKYRIVDGTYVEIYNNGDAVIKTTTRGALTLPETISDLPVKKIGKGAFKNCEYITAVSLPSTITEIDDFAFYGCSSLNTITLPENLVTIGAQPFYDTAIESINLPTKVRYLDGNPVAGCFYLDSITVSDKNKFFISEDGLLFNFKKTKLIACETYAEEIAIPDTVTEIGTEAFSCCILLTSVIFEGNAPTCDDDLYVDCDDVTSYVCEDAIGFTPLTWKGRPIEIVGSGKILTDGTWYYTLDDDGYATLQNNGKCALVNPAGITSLTLPVSVDGHAVIALGDKAVAGVKGITVATIPGTYEYIGDGAFSNCASLASISIGNGVRSIGYRPFYNTAITSLTIPDSVSEIDGNPGAGASMLKSITVSDSQPYFSTVDGLLYDKNATTLLACPATKSEVSLPTTVTDIAEDAFYGCHLIAGGSDVKGNTTFTYTTDGTKATISDITGATGVVTIPAKLGGLPVTAIDSTALNGCTGITEFVSLSSAFTAKNKCLYSADGTVLVRVPDRLILPYSVKTTTTTFDETKTVRTSGVTYTTNTPTTVSTSADFAGDITFESLLKDVVIIRDYAFKGCNVFTETKSSSSKQIDYGTGKISEKETYSYYIASYTSTWTTHTTKLALSSSIRKVEPNALTGSGITYNGALPSITVNDYPYEIELAALNAASAIALADAEFFPLSSPDSSIVSDAQYRSYFTLTATPVAGKSGYYNVNAELDPTAIDLPTSRAQMAAKIGDIAAGTTDRVVMNVKPGLYYAIYSAATLNEDFKLVDSRLATEDELELLMTRPSSNSGYYQLEVSVTNPVK